MHFRKYRKTKVYGGNELGAIRSEQNKNHTRKPKKLFKYLGKTKIEIRCSLNGNTINIEVRDEGRGVPEEIKKGIYTKGTGLRNVNERLLKTYGEGYGLKIKENHPRGSIAAITIPRETK